MCQFCLFLLVQSHQIYVVDIFLNLTSKVFPLRPAFLTALSRGKTGKRRMRIFISSLAGKSWGYRRNFGNLGAITALKFFWEFLLKNTFFRLVQYGAKVEIFIGQRMKTKIAMALPTQGLNALTKINKIRPAVNIFTSHATSSHNMQPPVIIRISFPNF